MTTDQGIVELKAVFDLKNYILKERKLKYEEATDSHQ
jgi:hypothetical protein